MGFGFLIERFYDNYFDAIMHSVSYFPTVIYCTCTRCYLLYMYVNSITVGNDKIQIYTYVCIERNLKVTGH